MQMHLVNNKLKPEEFFNKVMKDSAYQESFWLRARAGTLPAALEVRMWEYIFGKPVEKVEMQVSKSDLHGLSNEELADRATKIAEALKTAKVA